eukprot:TRINITY_DN1682_c0_g1_i13.p1 TRINITY_DN1682_c0_g1~~TRINITY_DN1682_c0_g1_i13.p1  ORF type:complete len:432 (-),score=103.41 TRINITY_DN1682_c0_g1_i13:467-1762(-)
MRSNPAIMTEVKKDAAKDKIKASTSDMVHKPNAHMQLESLGGTSVTTPQFEKSNLKGGLEPLGPKPSSAGGNREKIEPTSLPVRPSSAKGKDTASETSNKGKNEIGKLPLENNNFIPEEIDDESLGDKDDALDAGFIQSPNRTPMDHSPVDRGGSRLAKSDASKTPNLTDKSRDLTDNDNEYDLPDIKGGVRGLLSRSRRDKASAEQSSFESKSKNSTINNLDNSNSAKNNNNNNNGKRVIEDANILDSPRQLVTNKRKDQDKNNDNFFQSESKKKGGLADLPPITGKESMKEPNKISGTSLDQSKNSLDYSRESLSGRNQSSQNKNTNNNPKDLGNQKGNNKGDVNKKGRPVTPPDIPIDDEYPIEDEHAVVEDEEEQVFYIDENGFLMNEHGEYAVDENGERIQYTPEQLAELQQQEQFDDEIEYMLPG